MNAHTEVFSSLVKNAAASIHNLVLKIKRIPHNNISLAIN